MSLMPNPGSLVRLTSGEYGLVTRVTPHGDEDKVVVLSAQGVYSVNGRECLNSIEEIIHEPELPVGP